MELVLIDFLDFAILILVFNPAQKWCGSLVLNFGPCLA